MSKLKKRPRFKNEDEERKFWLKNDSSDFIDWKNSKAGLFPNLKPSVKSISIRLPEMMLSKLKILANKSDIPYQSLIKLYLNERLEQEKV
ncbi:MAG: BrnA antitoxin family protein [FCB group bacterium]|jgi:predicted DNA binding CopG/RHH family protein